MATLKNIIEREYRRMLKAGIINATREEALGYLIWRRYRGQGWKLFRVIHWMLRYADYHHEAVEVDHLSDRRLSADCASLRWSERRRRMSA
jgi:hypothetical protein